MQQNNKTIKVLDHGFVTLRNLSGPTRRIFDEHEIHGTEPRQFDADDTDPANTARMSFDQMDSGRTREMDLKLVEYLMKNWHTTPLEMIEVWIEMKMPIFVARQFVRHRTACINEVSGRYIQLPAEWYIPEVVGKKASDKKQGQTDGLYWQTAQQFKEDLQMMCEKGYQLYSNAIMTDVAPEHARLFLHVNHYTHWIWKQDLHNLMHFLALRVDSHAQIEAQAYANAIIDLIRPYLPNSMALFDKYRRKQEQIVFAPTYTDTDNDITKLSAIADEVLNMESEQNIKDSDESTFIHDGIESAVIVNGTVNEEPPVIVYSDMVRDLAKPGEAIIGGMSPAAAHCLHMAVGLAGEMTELLAAIGNNDRTNIIEELGDAEFFYLGLFQCGEMFPDLVMFDPSILFEFPEHRTWTDNLLIEAGELLDIAKRVAIYGDASKWSLFAAQMPRFRCALNTAYAKLGIDIEEAVEGNIYKLALGPKARYKGGKYSDAAAINRADKQ